jgi:F0F1-type ATP synthase assembly protein I
MQHDQLDLTQQHQQSKKQAFVFIKAQFLITLLITAICLFFDVVVAYSALTGGTIAAVASAWFAYKVFRLSPDSAAESMVASAFMGEVYKVILTGALFICAFVLIKPVSAVTLLITYFIVHMTPAMVSSLGLNTSDMENKREK